MCDKNNYYTTINLEALNRAMLKLNTAGEIKTWIYFSKNQNGYKFDLTKQDLYNWGIPKSTFDKAKKKLIEYGYLKNINGSLYIFDEMPEENPETEKD